MLSLAGVRAGEVVFDLGSGDGRIVITAARDFGARAVGVEARAGLVAESRRRIGELGLSRTARVVQGSWEDVSLRGADVVATFISSVNLGRLRPKLERELRPGARLVNFGFPVPGWAVARRVEVVPRRWKVPRPIYLHVVPGGTVPHGPASRRGPGGALAKQTAGARVRGAPSAGAFPGPARGAARQSSPG